jgi:hypothetical protein
VELKAPEEDDEEEEEEDDEVMMVVVQGMPVVRSAAAAGGQSQIRNDQLMDEQRLERIKQRQRERLLLQDKIVILRKVSPLPQSLPLLF